MAYDEQLGQKILQYLEDTGAQAAVQVSVSFDIDEQQAKDTLEYLCQTGEARRAPPPLKFKRYPGFFDEQGNPLIWIYHRIKPRKSFIEEAREILFGAPQERQEK